jgi:hypothetical protein
MNYAGKHMHLCFNWASCNEVILVGGGIVKHVDQQAAIKTIGHKSCKNTHYIVCLYIVHNSAGNRPGTGRVACDRVCGNECLTAGKLRAETQTMVWGVAVKFPE